MSVEDTWLRQCRWSALANAKTAALERWRWINLSLVLLGAVAGVLASESWFRFVPSGAVSVVGVVALTCAAFIQANFLNAEKVKARVKARAAAESIKAAVYQYLAVVAPSEGSTREADIDGVFAQVWHVADELVAEARQTTPENKPAPDFSGVVGYVDARAKDQLRYHDERGRRHAVLEKRWRAAEIVATLLAAVLSAVNGISELNLSAWVGVVTTIAGAVAAHIAGEQHARISASYAVTADLLERRIKGFDAATADAQAATAFVVDIEEILARQNQTWVATLVPSA